MSGHITGISVGPFYATKSSWYWVPWFFWHRDHVCLIVFCFGFGWVSPAARRQLQRPLVSINAFGRKLV